jgi:hypothetical protein
VTLGFWHSTDYGVSCALCSVGDQRRYAGGNYAPRLVHKSRNCSSWLVCISLNFGTPPHCLRRALHTLHLIAFAEHSTRTIMAAGQTGHTRPYGSFIGK